MLPREHAPHPSEWRLRNLHVSTALSLDAGRLAFCQGTCIWWLLVMDFPVCFMKSCTGILWRTLAALRWTSLSVWQGPWGSKLFMVDTEIPRDLACHWLTRGKSGIGETLALWACITQGCWLRGQRAVCSSRKPRSVGSNWGPALRGVSALWSQISQRKMSTGNSSLVHVDARLGEGNECCTWGSQRTGVQRVFSTWPYSSPGWL